MSGALLVAGTTSDAGKSIVTAGICRWLVRQGVSVAPFKAQNMSNNSMVTAGGAEIGRAQAMQAAAARVEPEAAMNPVLLKPGGDNSSQVVVLGRAVTEVTALSYRPMKAALLEQVLASLADLRSRFDVVICEGAGSPTEINLRGDDIANMGLATAAQLPVVVVGDIDRGGLFPALYGTVALMPPADQRLVAGFLVNKFRGDVRLLEPGLLELARLTGRPTLGVLPWLGGLELDVEDSLDLPTRGTLAAPPHGEDVLRVAVARLPRLSNFTDLDALAAEPGVLVRYVTRPEELADADLVVLPGTRSTVADLAWLRESGLAEAVRRHAAGDGPVLGICGGHQMLARTITDHVESRVGTVPGLALLPTDVRFAPEKTLGRPTGTALGQPVHGYEIHHGVVTVDRDSVTPPAQPFLDGARAGSVFGTTWHGALENDGFRRAFLTEVARITGRRFVPAPDTDFAHHREARLDRLGDLVAEHADTPALWRLIEAGAPPDLPLLPPGSFAG
ncbi:cobyric acid synthase [Blastococcus sp. CT_GayMR20]|uniref:cobyric acid synthase n=1 Tax=Blastococcus sp. CT_GayMR20 TaxID=2559609 RepID=UPI001073CDED|nr:cobyric acid synthase [Blastococcus sp. CT_GayMR20]TFV68547.1 cobyric acid synthase [Blastococcus sp. CT_GayMR20]